MPRNQSLTVEYVVTGALDGTTAAPPIVIDQSAEDATPFDADEQIYRVEVENLGLIDPDLGGGGSIGPRCLPFIWISTDETGATGAAIEVVGVVGDEARLQRLVEDLDGKAGTYNDDGVDVPQGSSLRVSGFTAGVEPIVVRVSIYTPASCSYFALSAIARVGESGGVPGSTTNCLTRFLVSPEPEGAPYQSIQTAYDAAKAAGKGLDDPAVVLVCAGRYTEDVLLDVPGIDVVAVVQDSQQPANVVAGRAQTSLVGRLTIDLTAAPGGRNDTSARWQGIDVLSETGAAVVMGGPNNAACFVYLADCQVISLDDNAVQITNTGVDGPLASVLDAQRVTIANEVAVPAVSVLGVAFPFPAFIAKDISIFTPDVGIHSELGFIGLDTAIISAAAGGIEMIASFFRADDTVWQVTGAFAFDISPYSVARVLTSNITASPGIPFAIGGGVFIHDAIPFLGTAVPPWDTSLIVRSDQAIPQEAHVVRIALDGGVHTLTSETNIVVESTALGGTIALPPTARRPGPFRLKLGAGNLGAVSVAAAATNAIRLPGAPPASVVPLTDPGFVLVSDPAATVWEGWS